MERNGGSQNASPPIAHGTTIKLILKNNDGQSIVLALILWNNEGQYVGFAHCLTQRMPPKHGESQREGMGLLEYQIMPSLRDVAHDGWLCTFTI